MIGHMRVLSPEELVEVKMPCVLRESLMKARVGDVIKVDLPRGTKRFEVVEIL